MKTKQFLLMLTLFPLLVSASVKTSNKSGNWSNPTVWTPYGIPTLGDKIKIYHTLVLDQNYTTSDTVFVYAVLSINSNRTLTLNPGTMILVNTATYDGRIGAVANGGKIVGSFIFQKFINRCDGFSSYGSPFTVLKTDFDWYYCYQCMGNGWSNLYYYDESVSGTPDMGYYDNIGLNLYRGHGFFYWFENYIGGQNFGRQISLKGSIDFNAKFDFNVGYTPNTGAINDGFNLISNPFPGTIDWTANSAWTKAKVNNAIYVWNSCSNSYSTYIGCVGVNGGSRYIPSMQGFWVQTNGNNPQLKVSSTALVNLSQNLLKSTTNSNSLDYVLKLILNSDEIAIRLDSNSTSILDSLTDARKFFSDSSKIYSVISQGLDDYAINSIKDSNNVIPVKIKGSGTLIFSGVSTFLGEYSIYLKDLENNQYQTISEGMQYPFIDTSTVTFNTRFEIHFIKSSIAGIPNINEALGKITYNDELIFISLAQDVQIPVTIKLVDLLGRELYFGVFANREIVVQRKNIPSILTVFNKNERLERKIF